jgi:hypothetical protein
MQPTSRSDWERLPDDPDPERDLGYVRASLSVVRTENGKGHYLFLPEDEQDIRDEAFIIADDSAVRELHTAV